MIIMRVSEKWTFGATESRRKVLRILGGLAGLGVMVQSAGADEVTTRSCADEEIDELHDWATGAVTAHACAGSTDPMVYVEATGGVSAERYPDAAQIHEGMTTHLVPGETRTIWYGGQLSNFAVSNEDINIGIANRETAAVQEVPWEEQPFGIRRGDGDETDGAPDSEDPEPDPEPEPDHETNQNGHERDESAEDDTMTENDTHNEAGPKDRDRPKDRRDTDERPVRDEPEDKEAEADHEPPEIDLLPEDEDE